MAAAGKFERPKTQNKWPGIGAVDKITTLKPPNHNMKTIAFKVQYHCQFKHSANILEY